MLGVAAMALRNLGVSGMPLPATFYAKVGGPGSSTLSSLYDGFVELVTGSSSSIGPRLVAVFVLPPTRWARYCGTIEPSQIPRRVRLTDYSPSPCPSC